MKRNQNKLVVIAIGFVGAAFFGGCAPVGDVKPRSSEQTSDLYTSCSAECDSKEASPFFDHKDFAVRLRKAGEVSAILEELGESRDNFLKTGDFIDLFPMISFHVTKIEFDKVLANRSNNSIDKLKMIISFYDAYRFNRESFESGGAKAVEEHWQTYFKKAVEANTSTELSKKYDKMSEIMFDGVEAHLVYDIPRFVRVFSLRSPKRIEELKTEFDSLDTSFDDAALKADEDIVKALGKTDKKEEVGVNVFKTGASYIVLARKKSWNLGVSSKPLPTKKPQPVFQHNTQSRKYFPKEVLRRGVCRKTRIKDQCEFPGYRRFILAK